MNKPIRVIILIILGGIIDSSLLQKDAQAYIDPGAGALLFQVLFIIFTAAVGILAAGKKRFLKIISFPWRIIRGLFKRIRRSTK